MLDIISVVLWSLAYVLILFAYVKHRKQKRRSIPIIFASLSLAWEMDVFLITSGSFWGHWFWLILDICIFTYSLYTIDIVWKKCVYIVYVFSLVAIMFLLSRMDARWILVSSFIINFIGSVRYWLERKQLLSQGKCMIAIAKLLGSLAATIYYAPYSIFVGILGSTFFVVDVMYLAYCVRERYSVIDPL